MFRRVFIAAALAVLMVSAGSAQRRTDKAQAIAKELKLDKQRKDVEAILDAAQKKAAPLMQQINSVRQKMLNISVSGQDAAPAVQQLASLRTQMLGIETDALQQLLAKADAKQKSKAPKVFELMFGLFDGADWRTR